jgi:hypothetical protein
MRKFICSSPLAVPVIALLIFTISFLIINACRKIERIDSSLKIDNTERFFKMPENTHPAVKRVADKMKRMDQRYKFINKFINKQGFALWDKAIVTAGEAARGQSSSNYSMLIPLVWDNYDLVHAVIAAKVTADSVYWTLLDASNYGDYNANAASRGLDGHQLELTLIHLDNTVFGHKKFRIEDSTAFSINGHSASYVDAPSQDSVTLHEGTARAEIYQITVCWDIAIPANSGQVVGCPPGLDCPLYVIEHYCETWTISGDDGYGIDDDDPAPPDGGSGGGGGNDLCRLFPGTEHPCGNGEPPPYVPITDYDDSFNPNIFDSLRIADILRDSFPCAYHIIHDTLYNINQLVQNQMLSNFFVSQVNHVYFDIDWSLGPDSPTIAYARPHGSISTINYITHWTDTIKFNPYHLKTMSKEMLMATVLHETVHAYIWWCWKEYRRPTPWGSGLISAEYLQQHFPLHWAWFNNQAWEHSYSHEAMVYNYKKYIYDYLYQHRDMSIDSNLWKWRADNLAKSGFWETTAWGNNLYRVGIDLSDTCTIRAVQYWNQHFSDPNASNFVWGNCRVTGTAFRDSLQMKTPCQ